MTQPQQTQQQQVPKAQSQHMFDIIVFDETEGENGSMQQSQNPQKGVFASSANELRMLYARCGQKIKIMQEYVENENGKYEPINGSPQQPGQLQMKQQAQSPDMLTMEQAKRLGIKLLKMPELPGVPQNQNVLPNQIPQQPVQVPPVAPQVQPAEKSKPKYFSIGGIECKELDGKIYQKQWVKADTKNYRLVSDANNKELPLTGKHIETLKWVVVENEEDQAEAGEEND